ncbi:MAG: ornithine--oxo-acid transaminase [Spirochaetota bacterium]|nr:MAG: ornithine--oxo-acid transaminase [Spirochaetota bacterium]
MPDKQSTEIPTKTSHYITLEETYGAKNYLPLDVVLSRGEGIWVWDVEGNRYMDMLSAYSALNQGHCHPRIVQSLVDQSKKLALTSRAFRHDQLGLFYKEICGLLDSDMVLPMNSGAEAIETAIKAVRKWGYTKKGIPEDRAEILVCQNNFHGRTVTIVGFSTEHQYKDGFGPFAPGFKAIPYGDPDALQKSITHFTAGFLVEPIQGEGGVIIPPQGYLKRVRGICDDLRIALILDEIQTGLGRTGRMLAQDWEGIKADVTVVGKALSGGMYPISAVLAKKSFLDVFKPGDHGSTFGGNPLACAVARTALKVLVEEKMLENAHDAGTYFINKLKEIKSPFIKEVRGKGLMIGVELHPEAGGARRFCEMLMKRGILCKETHEHVIRFAPPLIIKKDEIDRALERINTVLV